MGGVRGVRCEEEGGSTSNPAPTKSRMVPLIVAESGITLLVVPQLMAHTDTTALRKGDTDLPEMELMATTVIAAACRGSRAKCGDEPWPPAPWMVTDAGATTHEQVTNTRGGWHLQRRRADASWATYLQSRSSAPTPLRVAPTPRQAAAC